MRPLCGMQKKEEALCLDSSSSMEEGAAGNYAVGLWHSPRALDPLRPPPKVAEVAKERRGGGKRPNAKTQGGEKKKGREVEGKKEGRKTEA